MKLSSTLLISILIDLFFSEVSRNQGIVPLAMISDGNVIQENASRITGFAIKKISVQ